MKWTATLYNSLGCELASVSAPDLKELNALIIKWVLSNGDTIKIEGPEE
jgi:hypothetical protein